jgi:hypothetical protein
MLKELFMFAFKGASINEQKLMTFYMRAFQAFSREKLKNKYLQDMCDYSKHN